MLVKLTQRTVNRLARRNHDKPTRYWDQSKATPRGFNLLVLPTGTASYYLTYRFNEKQRWLVIEETRNVTLAQATKLDYERYVEILAGRDPLGERIAKRRASRAGDREERRRQTFEYLVEQYLIYARRTVPRSAAQKANLFKRMVERWGDRAAASITRSDVRNLHRETTDAGKLVMANQLVRHLSACFNWAISEEVAFVTINPCAGIKPNRLRSRERVFTDEELRSLWRAFDGIGLLPGAALRLQLLTACRISEITGMRWAEVSGRWFTLPAERSKNGRPHRVYLCDKLVRDDGAEFVFGNGRTQVPGPKVAEISGVVGFKPHDLRRTARTRMSDLGVSPEIGERILNHAIGGVAETYDRSTYDRAKQDAWQRWEEGLLRVIAGEPMVPATGGNVVSLVAARA